MAAKRKIRGKEIPDHIQNDKELDEAFEDEEEEEYDDEEQEEEYDPDDKFDQTENEPALDLSSLSEKQRRTLENNNKKITFLKALAIDPYQDIYELGKMSELRGQMPEQTIQQFMAFITEAKEDKDFPVRVLKYYESLVPENYPDRAVLDAHEVNSLLNLFEVYHKKMFNEAKITDPRKYFGNNQKINAKTINESEHKKEIVMTDSAANNNANPQDMMSNFGKIPGVEAINNGQGFQKPMMSESQELEHYGSIYNIPDLGIMELTLKRVPHQHPASVRPFITTFGELYNDWMQNPMKMLDHLKFSFGPTHGHHAYMLWKDLRQRYMQMLGYQQNVPANDYSPYGGFNNGGSLQPMNIQISPERQAEIDFDRRMNKTMQMMQMKMMETAMQNQMPMGGPMGGGSYEEIYDQNGKVIKRVYGPSNGAGNNPMESTIFQGMMTMMQEMLRGKNNEMLEVMKKINTPDSTMHDFTKTIMSNFVSQQNPASQVREMLELTNLVKNQIPQPNISKDLETTKMEIDSKLAMQELEMRKMEMQHNWRMDEKQQMEQDSNVDKWLNVMLQMGEGIIKPVAMKFVEGLGGANKFPNPLAALAGQQQIPPQEPPEIQQARAMRERQFIQQPPNYSSNFQPQPSRPEPPLQPIPPRQHQVNQPPPQQQQQVPPPMNEQELQMRLSQLSPEQLQQAEDELALEDMQREKIRNMIRAQKNSRRAQRPQPTAQQVEAQNVLTQPPPVQEEDDDFEDEMEEDDFDDSEYEVPIARGVDKTVATNDKRQRQKSFKEFAPQTSTDITKRKKMSPQQKAMYAEGQLSEYELNQLPDINIDDNEEDEYSSDGVPLPAGIYNDSDEKLKEENLAQTRQKPEKKSRKSKTREEQKEQSEEISKDAEEVLNQVEEIPADEFSE